MSEDVSVVKHILSSATAAEEVANYRRSIEELMHKNEGLIRDKEALRARISELEHALETKTGAKAGLYRCRCPECGGDVFVEVRTENTVLRYESS